MPDGLKSIGAVKYAIDATNVPNHLERVAVVEIGVTDPVPPYLVQYDVTYYGTPEVIPAHREAIAAHTFVITDTIPNWIRRVVAAVISAIPWPMTDGRSLKFNIRDNSGHLMTAGV